MVQAGYWTWAHPSPGLPGIDTVPLTNLGGWLLAGVVLMTLLDVLVRRTSVAGAPRIGDGAPLLALGWMTLGGALAHAGWLDLPGSAAWGVGARRSGADRPPRRTAALSAAAVSGRLLRGPGRTRGRRRRARRAQRRAAPAASPSPPRLGRPVTVVLPVRDEEAQVEECLRGAAGPAGGRRPPGGRGGRRLDRRDRRPGPGRRRPPGPPGRRRGATRRLARQAGGVRRGRRGSRGRGPVRGRRGARLRRRRRAAFPRRPRRCDRGARRRTASTWSRRGRGRSRRASPSASSSPWPRGCGRRRCRCGWPSGRAAPRWPPPTASSSWWPRRGTGGRAGTPPSGARCSRTSRCCVR